MCASIFVAPQAPILSEKYLGWRTTSNKFAGLTSGFGAKYTTENICSKLSLILLFRLFFMSGVDVIGMEADAQHKTFACVYDVDSAFASNLLTTLRVFLVESACICIML